MQKRVVKIHIVYEDGSEDLAEGKDAQKIWDWLNACQVMNSIHGAVYTGPKFIHKEAELK